ncbi:MAG: YwiC-like family protein [marine benthic group bacterium]|nr:YwiC-like family protein [Candidatus Carthagonibacter metallireducens]
MLGLLLAPGAAGVAIGIATIAGFLVRHPGRMYWKNRHRLDASPRYRIARRFAFAYTLVATAALLVAWAMAGIRPLIPFLIAAPFVLLFTAYDLRHQARKLLPELLAPTLVAVSAPAIVLADGWTGVGATVVWLLLALRSIPTVLYVRARLRQERGKPRSATASNVAHTSALLMGGGLARAGLAPWSAVAALALLLVRAAVGLSALHRPAAPKAIGFAEIAYGSIFVLLTAAGYSALR